jgi:hypothetical protein
MPTKRIYNDNWKKIILSEQTAPIATVKPGNFYKIEIYKYLDGKTRTLSGTKTAYVFAIGRYTDNGKSYFAALKLKNIDPLYFFNDIKLMLSPLPPTSKDIDEAYNDTQSNDNSEFSNLLKKIPKDGKNLFSTIKTKSRIYEGNYREYIVSSIKSIKYLNIDPEFLKTVLTKDAKKTRNLKSANSETNSSKPETQK